jgi:hypothetical protein
VSLRGPTRPVEASELLRDVAARLEWFEQARPAERPAQVEAELELLDGCLSDLYLASGAAENAGWTRVTGQAEALDLRLKALLEERAPRLRPNRRLELVRAARLVPPERATGRVRSLRARCLGLANGLERAAEHEFERRVPVEGRETSLGELQHRLRDPSVWDGFPKRDRQRIERRVSAAKKALFPALAKLLNQRNALATAAGHRDYVSYAHAGDPVVSGRREVEASLTALRAWRDRLVAFEASLPEAPARAAFAEPQEALLVELWRWLGEQGIAVEPEGGPAIGSKDRASDRGAPDGRAGAPFATSVRLTDGTVSGSLRLDLRARRGKSPGEWFTWGRVRAASREPDGWVVASLGRSRRTSVGDAAALVASLAHELGHATQYLINRSIVPFASCARTTPPSCIEIASYVFQLSTGARVRELERRTGTAGLLGAWVRQLVEEIDRILRRTELDLVLHSRGGWTPARLRALEQERPSGPFGLLGSISAACNDEYAGRFGCYAVSLNVAARVVFGDGDLTGIAVDPEYRSAEASAPLSHFIRDVLAVDGVEPLVRLARQTLHAGRTAARRSGARTR